MTLFCDGRVILLAVPTSLHINTLERQPGLFGTSIGETARAYASAVGLGKGVSFSCMKWNRSLKLSPRNFQTDLPRILLVWAHTMTVGRVLGGQFQLIIMLYRRTQLAHLTLLDFWGLRHTRRQERKVTCRLAVNSSQWASFELSKYILDTETKGNKQNKKLIVNYSSLNLNAILFFIYTPQKLSDRWKRIHNDYAWFLLFNKFLRKTEWRNQRYWRIEGKRLLSLYCLII